MSSQKVRRMNQLNSVTNKQLVNTQVAVNKAVTNSFGNKPISTKNSFQEILEQKGKESIKFSNHANKRLEDRGIKLSNEEIGQLNEAIKMMQQKGAKDSLIVINNLAMIVNIPNKTVITALNQEGTKGNIYTNIDSAIFL